MLSKTLDKVVLAEKKAAEQVDLANKKSEEIIAGAHRMAKEIKLKAKQDSQAEVENLIRKNNILINEIFEDNNKASDDEARSLRAMAESKKEKAVNMVIEKIISG